MRIIAGKYKGKVLKTFELASTRPTTDMVREALFDKIGLDVEGKIFLDLFAGTGANGIEALSRGAKFCYFVDAEKKAVELVKKNLALVVEKKAVVLQIDYETALQNFSKQKLKFDFIFLDPPYKTDFAERAIEMAKTISLLNKNGLLIWEHDQTKNDYINSHFLNFKTKKYGKKFLTYIYDFE